MKNAALGYLSHWPSLKLIPPAILVASAITIGLFWPVYSPPDLPPDGRYIVAAVRIYEPYVLDAATYTAVTYISNHQTAEAQLVKVTVEDGPENLMMVRDGGTTLVLREDFLVDRTTKLEQDSKIGFLAFVLALIFWATLVTSSSATPCVERNGKAGEQHTTSMMTRQKPPCRKEAWTGYKQQIKRLSLTDSSRTLERSKR